MRYIYSVLVLLLSFSLLQAQSDFNEPPTRSEFEQLKSKVQVYERNQNNALARINSFNEDIDNAYMQLDSMMMVQKQYLDSVINRMALESQGVQAEAVAKFLTAEDLDPIHEEIVKKSEEAEEYSLLIVYAAGGGIALVLILVIVFFILSIRKTNKLKKELLANQEENLAEMQDRLDNLRTDLMGKLNSDLNDLEVKLKSNILNSESKQKTNLMNLEDALREKMEENKLDLKASIDRLRKESFTEIDDQFKKADVKMNKISTDNKKGNKEINEDVSTVKTKMEDIISSLGSLEKEIVIIKQNNDK